jgi:hypothetical protein
MSKPCIEALECFDNCFDILGRASALVETVSCLSEGFRNLNSEIIYYYFVTINDLLNQLKKGLNELNSLLKP